MATPTRTGRVMTAMATDDGLLVALSGGVDSAVALLRLVAAGRRVEAAIVELWPEDEPGSCRGPAAVARARSVAEACGVRLHVLDARARFARTVVEPFVAAYLGGTTPNPCVTCNPMRLAALVGLADELGLAHVATGHYARLVRRAHGPRLARGVDRAKDQSYMLAMVPPKVLARLEFPLGEASKRDVRTAAREAGLAVSGEPESQEVCFAPRGYRHFLEGRGVRPRRGPIVDRGGRVLGEHGGHWRFTIGQRRGLGLSAGAPLYVVERRAATNEVVVGKAADLHTRTVVVRDVVGLGIAADEVAPAAAAGDVASGTASAPRLPPGDLTVQLRYRSAAVPVMALEPLAPDAVGAPAGGVLVRLAAPFAAPAPGQAAVFYRGDEVVAAAVIAAEAVSQGPVKPREYDTVS